MCLGVCLSSYGMKSEFPVVHDSERGSRTNALTIGRLAFLEALGSKASGTYAQWHERPAKKSVGHFKQGILKNNSTEGKVMHRVSHYGSAQRSAPEPTWSKSLTPGVRHHETKEIN